MVGSYNVCFDNQIVGWVTVTRQGLYAIISCRCGVTGGKKYDLYAKTETGKCSLGLLYAADGGYGLDTRIPVKKLGQGSIQFLIEQKMEQACSISLHCQIPTSVLLALEQYSYARSEGKPCLVLRNEKNG